VIAKGEHLCMTMRGIKTRGLMSSSAVHGAFRRAEVRAEFLRLALG
jgi:GTP cyclohydrolase I